MSGEVVLGSRCFSALVTVSGVIRRGAGAWRWEVFFLLRWTQRDCCSVSALRPPFCAFSFIVLPHWDPHWERNRGRRWKKLMVLLCRVLKMIVEYDFKWKIWLLMEVSVISCSLIQYLSIVYTHGNNFLLFNDISIVKCDTGMANYHPN